MTSADFDRDLITKAQRFQPETEAPKADPRTNGNLASALGNAGVQRLLRSASLHRSEDGSGPVDDEVSRAIQSKRGTGAPLDNAARADLEPSLGSDFSDVRVHTDGEADALNHAVSSEAFTTGRDIFFRSGNYNPGSADGRKLLAHELTHVVQQRSAPAQSGLTVSSPDDSSEREASAVADSLGGQGATASAAPVSRAEMPEEEEEVATARLEREEMPEEEEEQVATTPLARAEAEVPEEEEQVAMTPLDRAEMPEEEEEVATMPLAREDAPQEDVPV